MNYLLSGKSFRNVTAFWKCKALSFRVEAIGGQSKSTLFTISHVIVVDHSLCYRSWLLMHGRLFEILHFSKVLDFTT